MEARRPGGTILSLVEQEGMLARALSCAELSLTSETEVEPVSLDSFAALLEVQPSQEAMLEFAAELRNAIQKHLSLDTGFEIDVTMGLALSPVHAGDPEGLLEAANAALASASPEKPVRGYSAKAKEVAEKREALATRLRHAIEREELCLHYQPQVDPRSGRTVGFEALVRWNLDGRCLAPGAFFPLAGENFFVSMGEWVLREALRQVAEWRSRGLPVQRVAVNLMAQQLREGDLLGMVRSLLRRSDLEGQALELELTETYLVEQLERCGEMFEELRSTGVRIAIDDFGTGYSSLSYLRHLPVDTLKIDRTLTADVANNPINETVVSAVSQLAQGLQLTTVAEGVEREDQYLRLASLGCDRLQGYWIAKPLAVEDAESWLASR